MFFGKAAAGGRAAADICPPPLLGYMFEQGGRTRNSSDVGGQSPLVVMHRMLKIQKLSIRELHHETYWV